MKRFFEQYSKRSLWIAITCIAIGLVLHWVDIFKVSKESYFSGLINQKLNRIYEEVIREQDEFSIRFSETDDLSFQELNNLVNYPTYIFEGSNLVYWSDNKFIPRDTLIDPVSTVSYFDTGSKKFLCVQKTLGYQTHHLLSLVPIYVENNINNYFLLSGFNQDIFIN